MAEAREMRALGERAAGTYSDIAGHHFRQKDEHTLAQLGKNQVLKASTGKPGGKARHFSSVLILLSGDSAFCRCSASAVPYWPRGRLHWR